MAEPKRDCVRCGEKPAINGDLCPHCRTMTENEARHGLARIDAYLTAWAAFDVWLSEHGRA